MACVNLREGAGPIVPGHGDARQVYERIMAIKNWHVLKIALVWFTCYAAAYFFFGVSQDSSWREWVVLVALLLAILFGVIPIIVTWKWASAREKRSH